MKLKLLILLITALGLPGPLHPPLYAEAGLSAGHQQIQDEVLAFIESHFPPEALDGSAAAHAGQRVEIEVGRIDPRLELAPCENPLDVRLNRNQRPMGRFTVRVQCHGSAPWAKYLPVTVRAFEQVLVSTRPLSRGSIVTQSDLDVMELDVSTLSEGYLKDPELAVGMEVRQSIRANSAMDARSLAPPVVIARGDTVVITARVGQALIQQQGTALEDGQTGRQINIRNRSSERVVRARVTGPGQVEVALE